MLICKICGVVRIDLRRHLETEHQMSSEQYRTAYGEIIVDPSVEEKRKETCIERYGDPNYKNKEATRLSNEIYKGGHSLRDPAIRARACKTKEQLYGNKNFTNREKAKETCLEKYGVENVAQIPCVVEKRIKTCIQRYGKIFNWERKDAFTREELIELHHNQGLTLGKIGTKFGQTPEGVGYWMRKLEVEVHKKIVSPKFKEYTDIKADVREYFEYCLKEKLVLSFSEFGKMTADKKNQKLKRLFNTGRIYHYFLGELKQVALYPEKWTEFLAKLC